MSACSFKVEGRGRFPVDMLRYDQCCPVFPDDAMTIARAVCEKNRGTWSIYLNSTKPHPTDARWGSFGWIVTEVQYFGGAA